MNALCSETLFPKELVEFAPYQHNPLFLSGQPKQWDEQMRERGWVMKDGEQYRLWYTGYMSEGIMRLGHATSTDGLKWQRDANNPLYSAHWVEDINIFKHAGRYYMFAEGLYDQAQLLVSDDGLKWTRQWKLDIRNTNGVPIEDGPYGTPVAWHEDGTWYLLYERRDLGLWLATSTNLITWTLVQDDPVFSPGPDVYDSDLIAANQVIKYQGRYYLFYQGRGKQSKDWTVNIATSSDLIHWIKYPKNPLLPQAWNKSSGMVLQEGNCFRLYTTHRQVDLFLSKTGCKQ